MNAYCRRRTLGVGVSGTFICLGDVGYVKTGSGEVRFSVPAGLRRQLVGVVRGR